MKQLEEKRYLIWQGRAYYKHKTEGKNPKAKRDRLFYIKK